MQPLSAPAVAILIAAALAACSVPTPGPATPTAPTAATGPARVSASPTAEPTPDQRPLQSLLPADFRGVEAHTFPVGQEMLERLAAAIGIRRRRLEAAYASDHGPAFVQMYALRAAGHEPGELLEALPRAAYPNAVAGSVTIEVRRLGDRRVTVISEPSQAASIGSFYACQDGGTLIVAQALAEPVAEAAIEELPPN
jgi:hypothetical protein